MRAFSPTSEPGAPTLLPMMFDRVCSLRGTLFVEKGCGRSVSIRLTLDSSRQQVA